MAKAFHQFRNFGRLIFSYYEKYPLIMNSAAGGTVYVAGELIVQLQNSKESNWKSLQSLQWKRIGEIGALGSVENGMFMLAWYNFLNKFVGRGVATEIILAKCLLDQLFFATQQDFLFLALCAYNHSEKLPMAIQEVKKNFLTTWLMDCSLWPIVNFVGFSFVPFKFQPTYMAGVQLFWQLYVSSVTNEAERDIPEISDEHLIAAFNDVDVDKSGFIDAEELQMALRARGIKPRPEEIAQMIADGDSLGEKDGLISLEEFKTVVRLGSTLPTAELWNTVRQERRLGKGAKVVMRKLEDMNKLPVDENNKESLRSAVEKKSKDSEDMDEEKKKENSFGLWYSSVAEFFTFNDNTQEAATNAASGMGLLTAAAIVRKIFFRI